MNDDTGNRMKKLFLKLLIKYLAAMVESGWSDASVVIRSLMSSEDINAILKLGWWNKQCINLFSYKCSNK